MIAVGDKLEPGSSVFRGMLLLDLQSALFHQAKRLPNADNVREKLKESMGVLQEAVAILKVDKGFEDMLTKRVVSVANEMK